VSDEKAHAGHAYGRSAERQREPEAVVDGVRGRGSWRHRQGAV